MSRRRNIASNPRVASAIAELKAAVLARYPTATFEVGPAQDNPGGIHLYATVDVEDPDEVLELVIDRIVELQVKERIPLHLITLQTPERVLAELRRRHGETSLAPTPG